MTYERNLPSPEKDMVVTWLHDLTPADIHGQGWRDINREFHGIAIGARIFAGHYPPEQRAAFFDGLTLGLAALLHTADMEEIRSMFEADAAVEQQNAA